MTKKVIAFSNLIEQVLDQLRDHGYMESTLKVYRRTYNRVHVFINHQGTDFYSEPLGEEFLQSINVSSHTLSAYACAIRRLDDYVNGNPYRCHHDNPADKVPEKYASVLKEFLDNSRTAGNKPATLHAKEWACIKFLNCIEQLGCTSLSEMDASTVSRALLVFNNKDNYAIIRQFLEYLANNTFLPDLSGIVPKYKRRKILPTTYTMDEVGKVEDSINTSTTTGKRDLAVLRLATRMGLRAGDIAKLKWSEVNFNTGYISIIQEKTSVPLSLQMPQDVSSALRQHLENLVSLPEDGYVFHSRSAPYGRITTSIIKYIVHKGFASAGVDITGKKHGPHALRSSLASSMLNDGGSYETVRRILGHTDPDVIKHYARTDVEKLRSCAIEPPLPSGMFYEYLTGKKVIRHV